jgi:ATP/maltotriose-dependent transcriptional regulator MalT
MIRTAPDADAARAVVDVAVQSTAPDDDCTFCAVMFAVPAAIACADVGDLADARRHLQRAEHSTAQWSGTAWQAATLEARAHLTLAEGDAAAAATDLAAAAELFRQSGQPLDAARCRRSFDGPAVAAVRQSWSR